MELFAERGHRGPTLKAVAERAEVSPGLVQHHFKTKQGLLASVQSWVAEQLADIGGELSSGEVNLGVDSTRYDAFLAANPVVAAYLRRVLLESAATGSTEWFTDAVALRREGRSGDESESSQADVTAAMVVLVDLAPVLFGSVARPCAELRFRGVGRAMAPSGDRPSRAAVRPGRPGRLTESARRMCGFVRDTPSGRTNRHSQGGVAARCACG